MGKQNTYKNVILKPGKFMKVMVSVRKNMTNREVQDIMGSVFMSAQRVALCWNGPNTNYPVVCLSEGLGPDV